MQGSTSSPALANLTENSVILVISWCGRNMFRWSRGAISPVKGKPEGDFGQRTRAMAFVSSFTSWGGKGPPHNEALPPGWHSFPKNDRSKKFLTKRRLRLKIACKDECNSVLRGNRGGDEELFVRRIARCLRRAGAGVDWICSIGHDRGRRSRRDHGHRISRHSERQQ